MKKQLFVIVAVCVLCGTLVAGIVTSKQVAFVEDPGPLFISKLATIEDPGPMGASIKVAYVEDPGPMGIIKIIK